jgi:hypothetical protein
MPAFLPDGTFEAVLEADYDARDSLAIRTALDSLIELGRLPHADVAKSFLVGVPATPLASITRQFVALSAANANVRAALAKEDLDLGAHLPEVAAVFAAAVDLVGLLPRIATEETARMQWANATNRLETYAASIHSLARPQRGGEIYIDTSGAIQFAASPSALVTAVGPRATSSRVRTREEFELPETAGEQFDQLAEEVARDVRDRVEQQHLSPDDEVRGELARLRADVDRLRTELAARNQTDQRSWAKRLVGKLTYWSASLTLSGLLYALGTGVSFAVYNSMTVGAVGAFAQGYNNELFAEAGDVPLLRRFFAGYINSNGSPEPSLLKQAADFVVSRIFLRAGQAVSAMPTISVTTNQIGGFVSSLVRGDESTSMNIVAATTVLALAAFLAYALNAGVEEFRMRGRRRT